MRRAMEAVKSVGQRAPRTTRFRRSSCDDETRATIVVDEIDDDEAVGEDDDSDGGCCQIGVCGDARAGVRRLTAAICRPGSCV